MDKEYVKQKGGISRDYLHDLQLQLRKILFSRCEQDRTKEIVMMPGKRGDCEEWSKNINMVLPYGDY